MDRKEYWNQIDQLDNELLKLFTKRMNLSQQMAMYNKEHGILTQDSSGERERLTAIGDKAGDELRSSAYMLFSSLFELSRAQQERILDHQSQLGKNISDAAENTERVFPRHASVACQGIEGSYSQLACDRMFAEPNILYFTGFDAVFSAIRDDLCKYGILPLENSTAGSVNMVYDLMMRNNFKIVRSIRLKVDHSLLVKNGVKREEIREIVSHEQAIQQCTGYLKTFGKDVKITAVSNTAEAAKRVAESEENTIAALSSRSCGKLYGLTCMENSVQDRDNNYTRFICISKGLEIYPGADRTSIMLTTAHKPGALYRIMGLIYALGVNVVKLESRPIPGRDFEFMFYFDLETSVYSRQFGQLMNELESMCEEFHYLGSYLEMV